MYTVAVLGLVAFVVASGILLLGVFLCFKPTQFRSFSSPFDCGFDPIMGSREPISVRFFVVAVLFVVFDVEVVILLPILTNSMGMPLPLFAGYLLVLFLGLAHEWREGSLEWQS